MSEHPEVLSLSEFASYIKRDPSWVTRLRDADRLVLTADGRVRVRESLALIEATRGDRPDVAERNAERRAEASDPDASRRRARAEAELRIKRAEADRVELSRDREAGELLPREEVGYAMRDIGAFVRQALKQFPEQTAPLVVERLGLINGEAIGEVADVLTRECAATLERIAAKLREPQPYDKR